MEPTQAPLDVKDYFPSKESTLNLNRPHRQSKATNLRSDNAITLILNLSNLLSIRHVEIFFTAPARCPMVRLYLTKILSKALARTFRILDIVGILTPALVGTYFYLVGHRMPEAEATGSLIFGCTLVVLLLRLTTAPYFVWKDDQTTITSQAEQLADPARKSKTLLIAAFQNDRVELLRRLLSIQGDLRATNDANTFGDETAATLYQLAAPFLIDVHFKTSWFTFEKNIKAFAALNRFQKEKGASLTQTDEIKSLRRYSFHQLLSEGAVRSMILWLSHEKDHSAPHELAKKHSSDWHTSVDFTFALPPRARFDEVDWFMNEQDWNPPYPPQESPIQADT